MSEVPEPLKAVHPDGWDDMVYVGKWVIRFPSGLQSANALSRPEEGKTIAYIRADIHAARIADLTRQLAEARDKALEEAAVAADEWSGETFDGDPITVGDAIRNLKGPTP